MKFEQLVHGDLGETGEVVGANATTSAQDEGNGRRTKPFTPRGGLLQRHEILEPADDTADE